MSFCNSNITAADACTMDDLRIIAGLAYSVAAAVAVLPSLFLLGQFNKLVRSIFRSRLEKSRDILSVADGLLAAAPAPAMAIENLEA